MDSYSGATQTSHSNTTMASNRQWWPNQLNLSLLRQNSNLSDPMSAEFDYITAFNNLDYEALKADINFALTDSQDW